MQKPTPIYDTVPAPWQIVRVPFPYTNRPIEQFRPALVVARHVHQDIPTLLWVLMITSAVHRRWPGDIEIIDFAAAGLTSPSIVRSAKIATIEARDAQPAGRLPFPQQQALLQQFGGRLADLTATAAALS